MLPGKVYTPEDILRIIKRRIWWVLLPFALVSAGVAAWAYQLPDRYRAQTLILVVPQRVPEAYVRSTVTTRIEDRLQAIAQQIMSRTRLERIVQDFNLYAEERRTGIMEDIIEGMRRRDVVVDVVRGDSFSISYEGNDPRTVARVAERLASLFIEENLREREVLAEGTNQFLEAQLEDARRRLIEQEKKVEQYRIQFAGQLPSQMDSNLQVLQSTQMQMQALGESINRDRDRRLVLERLIGDLEAAVPGAAPTVTTASAASSDQPSGTLTQQLAAARSTLATLERRLRREHPDVVRASRTVQELEQKVEAAALDGTLTPPATVSPADLARQKRLEELRLELAQVDRQLSTKLRDQERLLGQAGDYQRRVEAAPARETEMTELTRDYQTLQQMYTTLLAKGEESKMAANLERRQIGEQFKVIDPARVPERPFSPNRPQLNMIGMTVGLVLSIMLVAVLEYRDKTFRTDHDVAQLLSVPVLAVVPLMRSASEQKWAFRKRVLLGLGLGAAVAGCLALVAYTMV